MFNENFEKIHENMLPGCFSAHGFLGSDKRKLVDILKADDLTVKGLSINHKAIADKMKYLTQAGKQGFGCTVIVDSIFEVTVEEYRGTIPCPYSDSHHAYKQNTQIKNLKTGKIISWTDLNIHMIEMHGFYEGVGSLFRIDPKDTIEILDL
jgi:hypothetical protein